MIVHCLFEQSATFKNMMHMITIFKMSLVKLIMSWTYSLKYVPRMTGNKAYLTGYPKMI